MWRDSGSVSPDPLLVHDDLFDVINRQCICWLDDNDLLHASSGYARISNHHLVVLTYISTASAGNNVPSSNTASPLFYPNHYGWLMTAQAKLLSKRFRNLTLYGVTRIIPLTLRIAHYSCAPAAWPEQPTIHVTGNWHTAKVEPELARLRGTVEMTASGNIRSTALGLFEVVLLVGVCFLVDYGTADAKTNWEKGWILVSF